MKKRKIALVVGTRPDIIKTAPIIRYLEENKADYFVVHTGQHYSYELDKIFFEELQLPQPKYRLDVKSVGPHRQGTHTGTLLLKMEEVLLKELPDVVLVHGDTNSALAGALLTSKISTTKAYTGYNIKLGHVEAGLRSYDRTMPEEVNRVICDHLSDYLFAPTESARQNALKEGIDEKKIFVVGNTIVDSVRQNLEISEEKKQLLNDLGLEPKKYALATVHRQENVDDKARYKGILEGLGKISKELGIKVAYPIHPRAKKMMEEFNLEKPKGVLFTEPVGFLEFLQLEANAKITITDSGGVQEESCILNVPCITVRDNTERPETLEMGANVLAGADPEKILECAKKMLKPGTINWESPFGDGKSAERICKLLLEQHT